MFAYRALLAGRSAVISFVTVAELEFGAAVANWAATRRALLSEALDRTGTIWADHALTRRHPALRAWCVKHGHGLGQKEHEADRWVAATAIALDVPLVSHDNVFRHVDGLNLRTRLGKDPPIERP